MDEYIYPACSFSQSNSIARSFSQHMVTASRFSCLEFGLAIDYKANVTVSLYIDTNGGTPDYGHMELVHSVYTETYSTASGHAPHTVSLNDVTIDFPGADDTLVVVIEFPPRVGDAAVASNYGMTYAFSGTCPV